MLVLFCEIDCCKKNYISCIYLCPSSQKKKCQSWNTNIDKIEAQPLDDKYITRYGTPTYYRKPIPKARKIAQIQDKPKSKSKEIKRSPKVKTKGELAECPKDAPIVKSGKKLLEKSKKDQSSGAGIVTEKSLEKPKVRKKRRTKAEMEEARKKEKKVKPKKPRGKIKG